MTLDEPSLDIKACFERSGLKNELETIVTNYFPAFKKVKSEEISGSALVEGKIVKVDYGIDFEFENYGSGDTLTGYIFGAETSDIYIELSYTPSGNPSLPTLIRKYPENADIALPDRILEHVDACFKDLKKEVAYSQATFLVKPFIKLGQMINLVG